MGVITLIRITKTTMRASTESNAPHIMSPTYSFSIAILPNVGTSTMASGHLNNEPHTAKTNSHRHQQQTLDHQPLIDLGPNLIRQRTCCVRSHPSASRSSVLESGSKTRHVRSLVLASCPKYVSRRPGVDAHHYHEFFSARGQHDAWVQTSLRRF